MIAKLLRPLSVRVVVLAIVYFALAYVNLAFFTFGQYDSFPTIWIPSGVALAVLLLTPRREWAAYLAGIFAASILAHSLNNTLLWLAICYSFISVLECTSAALLFQRFTDEKVSFQKLRETAIFVTVSALPASVLSAGLKIAVFCVAFPGVDFFIRWAGWSAAFYIGMIVITPLLVSTNYLLRKEFKASVAYVFERVAILLLVGVLAFAIFGDVGLGSPHSLPFFFLPFPVLIFAATRFGVAGACWISALLAVEAVLVISQTRNSLGYLYVSWHQKIWWLQSYVATASLSTMILAVLTTEGRKTRESLQSSEERLRILVQDMPVMFDAFDGDGLIVAWNKESERVTGYSAREVIGNENIVESM